MPGAVVQSDCTLAVEGVTPTENKSLGNDVFFVGLQVYCLQVQMAPPAVGDRAKSYSLEKSAIALVSDLEQIHSLFECEQT